MAYMARRHPDHCKVCHKPATARRIISARGKCGPCGEAIHVKAGLEIKTRSGPAYEAWVLGIAKAMARETGLSWVVPIEDDAEIIPLQDKQVS